MLQAAWRGRQSLRTSVTPSIRSVAHKISLARVNHSECNTQQPNPTYQLSADSQVKSKLLTMTNVDKIQDIQSPRRTPLDARNLSVVRKLVLQVVVLGVWITQEILAHIQRRTVAPTESGGDLYRHS